MSSLVSVIIPIFNAENYLSLCNTDIDIYLVLIYPNLHNSKLIPYRHRIQNIHPYQILQRNLFQDCIHNRWILS